jgi:hypothetical protein
MIHNESSFNILAQNSNGYIGECACCLKYNVAYKNVLLTFTEESMISFFEWLLQDRYSAESYWTMPHNRDRVFTTPFNNLYLTFNDAELDELTELYTTTCLVLEARNLVKPN